MARQDSRKARHDSRTGRHDSRKPGMTAAWSGTVHTIATIGPDDPDGLRARQGSRQSQRLRGAAKIVGRAMARSGLWRLLWGH